MGLDDINRGDIERSLERYRKQGREKFLWRLPMKPPKKFLLELNNGSTYPATAIVAHAAGGTVKLERDDVDAVRVLARLGYTVVPTPTPVRPRRTDRSLLDARFELERTHDAIAITFHSAGGGNRSRGQDPVNPDYRESLDLLFERLAAQHRLLRSVVIDSERAFDVKPSARKVRLRAPYSYPVALDAVDDIRDLVSAVCAGQNAAGRSTAAQGGNSRKRIRLEVTLQGEEDTSFGLEDFAGSWISAEAEKTSTDAGNSEESVTEAGRSSLEGVAEEVRLTRYERDPKNRETALKVHGSACKACGISMGNVYGSIGEGFIHIHHVVPLSAAGGPRQVRPETDLIPVCPNCHAMLHRGMPHGFARSVEDLRRLFRPRD